MTPFAEDVLDRFPDMEEFFAGAKFFDLNAKSGELYDRVTRFTEGELFSIDMKPADGRYWYEHSGFDRRFRVGFAATVEGMEMVSRVFVHYPDNELIAAQGRTYVLFSKHLFCAKNIGEPDLHHLFPLLLLAAVEITR